mmetsp:Transcript_24347/g.37032  ORF Transcript_24347/g.37032 Transcript_24347/m.37032 type:complete len:263 (+) Transcript_24347:53-841(+)|eukprot:CAMPEP_0178930938 /NCGR_PEP_ID=MMETSP0786-20121207/21603_1 /TAXON_ID=186022 /ORGANISM="Thalassionema frauenfeldii, Strain CCMP 1798" /LENGTH=262 /DNA_ID=CAMNT_0020607701 /DNA_START=17 /DNA_END=805 /DNA_ORIENTATION=+
MATEEDTPPVGTGGDGTKPPPLAHLDDDDDGEENSKKKGFDLQTIICAVLVIGSVVMYVISMAIEGSAVVIVAGLVAILIAPYASYQRYELLNMETLRQIQNELRDEVNRLTSENNELEGHTDRLQEQADRTKRAEANLHEIATSQGSNVKALISLVKENGELQTEMKKVLQQQVVEKVMEIIVQSDMNQDFHLEDREIDMVLLRIRSVQGIENLDEDKMKNLLKENRGLEGLMNIIRELSSDQEKMKMIRMSTKDLSVEGL